MSGQADHEQLTFAALSALADGEASSREVAQACEAWGAASDARERWHGYQLIGDVLRSESLARTGRQSDQQFLEQFRARLAEEPVVLAPAALAASQAASRLEPLHGGRLGTGTNGSAILRRRQWAGPTAVAAGFVLVLGALVTTLNGGALDAAQPSPAFAQASGGVWGEPSATLAQGWVGQEAMMAPALRTSLVADNAMGQRTASVAAPSFAEHVNEGATARAGNLGVIRDAQLDQLLAAQRGFAQANAFAPPSSLARSVAFETPGR